MNGKDLSVDGSFVEANAAKESRIPREQLAESAQVHQTVRQYLREVEEQNPVEEPVHQQQQCRPLVPFPQAIKAAGAIPGFYLTTPVDNESCVS